MLTIKFNLTTGDYIGRTDPGYIKPGREGAECCVPCPEFPYYRCTRSKGHDKNDRSDHAAHGWVGSRRFLGMFARWSQSIAEVPAIATVEQPIEPATVTDPEPNDGN